MKRLIALLIHGDHISIVVIVRIGNCLQFCKVVERADEISRIGCNSILHISLVSKLVL